MKSYKLMAPAKVVGTKAAQQSSTVIEDSIVKGRFVGKEAAVTLNDENLNPRIEAALEGAHTADSVEGPIYSVLTAKDPINVATSKPLDERTQDAVDGKVVLMDTKEITCPNFESMDTDAFNENFCFSVEELQASFETASGRTENHYDAFADVQSSRQPTLVVVEQRLGDVAATDNKVLLNSEENRKLLIEECSDHSTVGLNSTTSCHSAQAENYTNPNFKGPVDAHLDGFLASSGNDQHIKFEIDTEITSTNKDKVLILAAVVAEPSEKGQELKLKESLDKNVRDTLQADSNIGQLMVAQEQVAHFEQLGDEGNKATERNFDAEAVFMSAEIGILKDTYDKIKLQVVENSEIRDESSKRDGEDKSMLAGLFEPGKLVANMKALAQLPAGGADQPELVIAKSQLLAFYRLKGYSQLSEFCGGLSEKVDNLQFADEVVPTSPVYEDDGHISSRQEVLQTQRSSYNKRKHNIELSHNYLVSPSGKKQKCSDSLADESAMPKGRKTISLAKVSTTVPPLPKPSIKVGECISKAASLMTGSQSIVKANSQKQGSNSYGIAWDGSDISFQNNQDAEMRRMTVPTESSSLNELLLQLNMAAQDPLTSSSFLTTIVSFFSDFRNSVIMEQHDKVGDKRKHPIGVSPETFKFGYPETFEFEDIGDTYWTDRIIQNGSDEQPLCGSRNLDHLFVRMELDKPASNSNIRKRYSDGNSGQSAKKQAGYLDEKAPAELVMHFPVVDSVPSEIILNKMFRHFGPIKELETEVDKDTNRARVVFKKCSDAEAAYGSAPKFNIFGSILVNYQLNYTISVPFKSEPVATFQEEDATLFLQY
ncbi:uncharacterized protein LOC105634663 isoform X2 [Jatropha curcas]|nr:uncharacterized protein LOC105634663 isoform X2 [Jatropha curcas]